MNIQEIESNVKSKVEQFLTRAPLEKSVLILDGMGVNSAYHYFVLSALGYDRIKKLKKIYAISAGTFPLIFFWAYNTQQSSIALDDLKEWDKINRFSHGVRTFITPLKLLSSKFLKFNDGIFEKNGFSESFSKIVKDGFLDQKVRHLPENFVIPIFDRTNKKLEYINAREGGFEDLTLSETLCAAPAIKGLFPTVYFNSKNLIDPVYSPAAKGLIKGLIDNEENVLVSNLIKDEVKENILFLKPHSFTDGRKLFLKDMFLFVNNLPNTSIYKAAKYGLSMPVVRFSDEVDAE